MMGLSDLGGVAAQRQRIASLAFAGQMEDQRLHVVVAQDQDVLEIPQIEDALDDVLLAEELQMLIGLRPQGPADRLQPVFIGLRGC